MKDLSKKDNGTNLETLHVDVLLEVNKALSASFDLEKSFGEVMNILAFRLTMSHGALTLLDFETKELIAEVVYGTDKQGITEVDTHRKVCESGMPIAISSLGGFPLLLGGPEMLDIRKPNISYLCVPMKIEDRVVGVLSVDRLFDDSIGFHEDLRLLERITSVIAHTLNLYRVADKEKEDLITENKRLCEELEKVTSLKTSEENRPETFPLRHLSIEKVMEEKLRDIITVMDVSTEGKRNLYANVISRVEEALFKLALKKSKNVKCEAARFLGINRNTLYKKIKKLNIST